jgi:hypothetical protein
MENPQTAYYDEYIGADAIAKFLKKHPHIPDCESLEEDYSARFYSLYNKLKGYESSYTTAEEKSVEAMAVFDFCKSVSITAHFTESDKENLMCGAREVLTQCARALIPRAVP